MHPKNYIRLLTALLMLLSIWACAKKPFDPPRTGEIPEGPGLFSKDSDGVVLFDDQTSFGQAESRTPAGDPAITEPPTHKDFEEFEAFRQWQQWKKSNAGSAEYEAFKQWQQWRRYQKWKQDNQNGSGN